MFGFEPDGVTLRPAEAAEVVSAAHRLLEGVSVRELTQDLRRREVPTVEGGPWTTASLRRILARPRNAGIVVHKGVRVEIDPTWKPILAEKVHDAVVRILKDPGRVTAPGNVPRWLGSGIYRCACGGPMRVHGQGRYRCSRVALGEVNGIGHTAIPASQADHVVEEVVLARICMPDALDLFVGQPDDVDVTALLAEASTLRTRLSALAEDYADGVLTRAQLQAGTKRAEGRLREVDHQLARATGRSPLSPLIGARDVRAAWAKQPISTRRAIVDALIEVVVVRATPGLAFDPTRVEITWKSDL